MLTGFSIRNFKNLAAVPPVEGELIPFGPINVLIGPNGSGKSSLLQAIDFLRAFLRSSVEVYLQERGWEANDLPNLRNTSKLIRWELTAELDADEEGHGAGHYHYIITFRPKALLDITRELLEWTPHRRRSREVARSQRAGIQIDQSDSQHSSDVLNNRAAGQRHEPVRRVDSRPALPTDPALSQLDRRVSHLPHLGPQGPSQTRPGQGG